MDHPRLRPFPPPRGEGKTLDSLFIVLFLAAWSSRLFGRTQLFKRLVSLGSFFMAVALYMVGFGLHRSIVKKAGAQGILFGFLLWAVSIAVGYGLAVMS